MKIVELNKNNQINILIINNKKIKLNLNQNLFIKNLNKIFIVNKLIYKILIKIIIKILIIKLMI